MSKKKSAKKNKRKPEARIKIVIPKLSIKSFMFMVLSLTILGIFILVQNNFAVLNDMKTRKLDKQIENERMEQKELRISLAKLKSPARISRIARDELELEDPSQIVYVKFSRDADGNMICQSNLEKRIVKPPPPVEEEEEEGNTSTSAEESSTGTLSQR